MSMTNTDLIAIIKAHRDDSLGVSDGQLSAERAEAMNHYHGRPYGNEVEGRSSVVSRDLAEAVDWALPAIMRAFTQTGKLGEFDPVGPEDEQAAKQESDYVNQVLMKDNNGFMLLHDVFKDAMLLKNGYAKHFWEEEEKVREEEYSGLTMEAIQKMLGELEAYGSEVEIIGQESEMLPIPGMPQDQNAAQQIMTPQTVEIFEIKLRIKTKCGKLVAVPVPAEEVRVSKRCRGGLQESPFTEHVTRKTRSELIEMGMDADFVYSLPAYGEKDNDAERYARNTVVEENDVNGQSMTDKSMEEVEFCEAYVRVDYDQDKVAELRKVVTVAGRIPEGEEWNEPIEAVPMTSFVMKRVPHRHIGESLDDELADLQEIKTTLHRQLLDNVYLVNNSEKAVNERVNLKDVMTSTPGGIKRIKGLDPVGGAIEPLVTPSMLGDLLPAIDYWDKVKEVRTGIRPGSDMDPDMLQEVTKGAFLEQLNRASQKIEMMTRLLAEGVKEMFLQCHGILLRHQDRARVVQMRGQWVEVNPREWQQRTDLTVRVGLGTGNEEEKRAKLQTLFGMQGQLMQAVNSPPPVYARVYELFSEMAKTMGFEVPEKFAIPPNGPELQQIQQQASQQPNPEMAKVQGQQQLEQMRMQMQQQVDQHRQEVEAQQQQVKMQMEMELAKSKAEMQLQLEREKAQIAAQVQIEIARINAAAKIDAAQLSAASILTPQQEAASDNAVNQ